MFINIVGIYMFFRLLGSIKDSLSSCSRIGFPHGPFRGPSDWGFLPIPLDDFCEFCFLWVKRFPRLVGRGLVLLYFSLLPWFFPFPVHVTWKVLRSLGNPCGVELALVNSSLGMQLWFLSSLYLCIFLPNLAVVFFLPLSPVWGFYFLRDFSGALLSLFGAGLRLPWKCRELSFLFFLGSFSKRLMFQIRPFSSMRLRWVFGRAPPFSVGS